MGLCGSVIILTLCRKNIQDNEEVCLINKMEIKGIIVHESGHGIYNYIRVNNLEDPIRVRISKIKYSKGFDDDYTYQVGDSIIKQANTDEFTIRRGDKEAVHRIACWEWMTTF